MPETFELRTYAEYQKYNFFRTPEWRWARVKELAAKQPRPGRCTRRDDQYVRAGRSFLLRWTHPDGDKREELLWENPGLFYAYQFHERAEDDPEAAMYLQARLLAGQTADEIAEVMGVLPTTVDWYCRLFFDVRDRLKQRDWITKHVIVPAMIRTHQAAEDGAVPFRDSTVARPFMDGSLKLFAYFGGPHMVDLMLHGLPSGRHLTSPDEAGAWLDQAWSSILRRRSIQAATAFEINKYNVLELFAVHTRIMEIERSEDTQDQAKSATEKHIRAMVDDIPWAAGDSGAELLKGTLVGRFDDMSSELRDDELLQLASGRHAPTIADAFPDSLPPPRRDKRSVLLTADPEI